MPKPTALQDQHRQAGGCMVDFGGWALPVQYKESGTLAEHRHCRSQAALFDCSHMGQFRITGRDAAPALARVCTQDARALRPGRCKYGYLLDDAGGVLDDTILMRLDDDRFHLVVNAAGQDEDFAWLREQMPGGDYRLDNLSGEAQWSKIDLQGPESHRVLAPHAEIALPTLKYFAVTPARVAGREVLLSRTGYTGELGYEIMGLPSDIVALFEVLLEDERCRPAGLGARDSLRLEMGYPLYGHELDPETTPLEADGAAFLDLERDFIGAEALRRQSAEGTTRLLVAFSAETRRRTNPGDAILDGERAVGRVTSGAFSPSLTRSIGMGYVPPALAAPGTALRVRTQRADIEISVAEKPLYREGSCRVKL